MSVEPLLIDTLDQELWLAVVAMSEGKEASGTDRQRLVREGLVDADGRTPTPPLRQLLEGLRAPGRMFVSTISPRGVRTITVYSGAGPSIETIVEDGRADVLSVAPPSVPKRLADHLGLGPRGRLDIAPVAAPPTLLPTLAGDAQPAGLVDALVASFALSAPQVADALEDGDWRLSSTLVGSARGIDRPGVIVLDTREGAFLAVNDSGRVQLIPAATAEIWLMLSELLRQFD